MAVKPNNGKCKKSSWTMKCKNYIVSLLSFVIVFVLSLVSYEVFDDSNNQAVALALIGVLSVIVGGLVTLLPMLLKHEREKK